MNMSKMLERLHPFPKNASLGNRETPRVVFDLAQKNYDVLKTATTISTCMTIKQCFKKLSKFLGSVDTAECCAEPEPDASLSVQERGLLQSSDKREHGREP